MTVRTTAALDPVVLQGAAHELGHAVVDLAGGIAVAGITLNTRSGVGVTTVGTDLDRAGDPELWSAYLIACVAGYEAERLWSARHGGRVYRVQSATDFANFLRYRRRGNRLSEGAARAAARSILRREWTRVERLAPELARSGRLAGSALGGGRGWWR
jgi:hypothetical protein